MSTFMFTSEGDFISVNPWFNLTLESRLRSFGSSQTLRDTIDSRIASQFSRVASDSNAYASLTRQLQTVTDENIRRINAATETKVEEMVNSSPTFEPLRSQVFNAAVSRFDAQQRRFDTQFKDAEAQRNERIARLEKDLDRTDSHVMLLTVLSLVGSVVALRSHL